jgi:mannose-6-phosphate isomerase-like protein (cupin superfamily)
MDDETLPRGARLIKKDSITPIVETSNSAHVYPLARMYEGASSASVTRVDIDGRHQRLSSQRSTRLYFVMSGDLIFRLQDMNPVKVAAGDALEVPRNCAYDLEGTATYIVVNTPAFEEGDDIYQA